MFVVAIPPKVVMVTSKGPAGTPLLTQASITCVGLMYVNDVGTEPIFAVAAEVKLVPVTVMFVTLPSPGTRKEGLNPVIDGGFSEGHE